jgi:CHAD domain-containing protein
MTDQPEPLTAAFARAGVDPDRAYRLHGGEPVPDGMRRIARGRLDDARDALSAADDETLPEAVHETRKNLKRLRTTVRLTRDAIGERTYELENLVFRTAGRRLSAGRDAQVLLDTVGDLAERYPDELQGPTLATLRARLAEERDAAQRALGEDQRDEVLAALEKARARTADWAFERADFGALAPGLRRIYRRGHRDMRAAQADPTPDNLHEWRKRVKDLWHATQILCEARPKRLDRFATRAHKLSELLGERHDLDVLRAYLEANPKALAHGPSRRALLAAIERRSDELRDEALRRGRKLYGRKPRRFVARMERDWARVSP